MNALKRRLEAFHKSRAGLFIKKVLDDQSPNLAALLAWGTLNAMLPLMLGILSLAGLVLRDPRTLDRVYNAFLILVPSDATGLLAGALDSFRRSSPEGAGIAALVLLLFNGSGLFANMAAVFDRAYHVQSRNVVLQRLISMVVLIIASLLLIVLALAEGLASIVANVATLGLPIEPAMATLVGHSIAIVSAFVLFLLLYKILPNAKQGWGDVIPGSVLSTASFLLISQIFPIYVRLFRPNQVYAVFGIFLILTFWLYLLGWVFVLGAEVNAFVRDPSWSVALRRGHQCGGAGESWLPAERWQHSRPSRRVRTRAERQRFPGHANPLSARGRPHRVDVLAMGQRARRSHAIAGRLHPRPHWIARRGGATAEMSAAATERQLETRLPAYGGERSRRP